MSNRDQHELSELYKAMTRAEVEAKQRRIQDVKACAVFLFACWVLIGLCALIVTRC
jgi:hypothetical protein